jgi:hypothetical protein
LTAARNFALGEERRFLLDLKYATLTLTLRRRVEVKLDAQILATFHPDDRLFRWGWPYSTVDPMLLEAVNAARERVSAENFGP